MTLDEVLRLAVQHHQRGRLAEAEKLYRQILSRRPAHADSIHLLGLVAYQTGRNDEALKLLRRAVALMPGAPEPHSHLGAALSAAGQWDEAVVVCRRAVALGPGYPNAHTNLGTALKARGCLDEAIAAYRRAVELGPNDPTGRLNLGKALSDKGHLDEAIAAYRQAIALRPGDAEAHFNMANALFNKGQLGDALAAYQMAIAWRPDYADALICLGWALTVTGQPDQAVAVCRRVIALKPNAAGAYNNLGSALKEGGQIEEAIAAFRKSLAVSPDFVDALNNLAYSIHFHPGCDARAIAAEYFRWNERLAEPLKRLVLPHANDRDPDRRIRIGYVSPDLQAHPVGRFMLPLLAQHDRQGFEVFAYAHVRAPDDLTERLRGYTDGWRSIVGLSDEEVADLVRRDRIDILVDLTMQMADNRLLVFARKPAPVQVTYLAYCSSTGLDTIDYRLSDPWLDPPGEDESIYSERTIRLPETYWCYQPHIITPDVGLLPALEQGAVTFGCLNNFCKVSEPTLAVWCDLLRAVPGSQLLLHASEGSHRQRLLDRMHRDGVGPSRVRFTGRVGALEYFGLYQRIDIALDTFPYAGGTTTCDALWMGVPVVSLAGQTAVGRGGLSIMSNLDLPELVARTAEEYVGIAVSLAGDLPRLTQLRSTLRQRMLTSPLMDASKFARGIEAAYRWMWKTWCERV